MDLIQIVVLAIVQGITEFLPVSSSAHLILVPTFTGWADQGLAIDVALHVGTLLAVMLYFRRDVARLVTGTLDAGRGRMNADARLALQVLVATVPVVIAGLLLKDEISGSFRNPVIITATTVIFGLALWWADRRGTPAGGRPLGIADLTFRDALLIGLAQALALVPGVSRSGITMTAALFLGQARPEAARIALLLSIPTITAAGALATLDLIEAGDTTVQLDAILAAVLAFVAALVAIWAMMAWLRRATFLPFVVYRLALGAVLAGLLVAGLI